ncbi:MAG: radical SAM-associated putative lipoprotein [Bacteroidales bacterium]|nr:radical SAM-associated putative lipoprotein [Bacteroidales bacterium]
MKIISNIIRLFFCAMIISSCAAMDMQPSQSMDIPDMRILEGKISDLDGNPIEHIKVTADLDIYMSVQEVKYTDSDGSFMIEINADSSVPVTVTLTIEDIDGEKNGGLFETMVDTITLFEEDNANSIARLDYRLNRATASESSPQP